MLKPARKVDATRPAAAWPHLVFHCAQGIGISNSCCQVWHGLWAGAHAAAAPNRRNHRFTESPIDALNDLKVRRRLCCHIPADRHFQEVRHCELDGCPWRGISPAIFAHHAYSAFAHFGGKFVSSLVRGPSFQSAEPHQFTGALHHLLKASIFSGICL